VSVPPITATDYYCLKEIECIISLGPVESLDQGQESEVIGSYSFAFNAAEGWSRDVTEGTALALLEQEASEGGLSELLRGLSGAC